MPAALDESLVAFDPALLTADSRIAAFVLKPTLLGLDGALGLAERAASLGIRAVVTSSFESSVGLRILAECAAGLNRGADVAIGLGTAEWIHRSRSCRSMTNKELREGFDRVMSSRLQTARLKTQGDAAPKGENLAPRDTMLP